MRASTVSELVSGLMCVPTSTVGVRRMSLFFVPQNAQTRSDCIPFSNVRLCDKSTLQSHSFSHKERTFLAVFTILPSPRTSNLAFLIMFKKVSLLKTLTVLTIGAFFCPAVVSLPSQLSPRNSDVAPTCRGYDPNKTYKLMDITFTKTFWHSPDHDYPDHYDFSGVVQVTAMKQGDPAPSHYIKKPLTVTATVLDKYIELQVSKMEELWSPAWTPAVLVVPAKRQANGSLHYDLSSGLWIDFVYGGSWCGADTRFRMADIDTFVVARAI